MRRARYASPYGGSRFHGTSTCVGLNSTCVANLSNEASEITRAEVERRGLTACKICNPAPMLRAVS